MSRKHTATSAITKYEEALLEAAFEEQLTEACQTLRKQALTDEEAQLLLHADHSVPEHLRLLSGALLQRRRAIALRITRWLLAAVVITLSLAWVLCASLPDGSSAHIPGLTELHVPAELPEQATPHFLHCLPGSSQPFGCPSMVFLVRNASRPPYRRPVWPVEVSPLPQASRQPSAD